MTKLVEPEKHYVAHAGRVLMHDIVDVSSSGTIGFVGRVFQLPKGIIHMQPEMTFTVVGATELAYATPGEAFWGAQVVMNKMAGLGRCLLGYDPFARKH